MRRTTKWRWKIEAKEHSLCAIISPHTPDSIALATVHCPAKTPPEARAKHCEVVAKFLANLEQQFLSSKKISMTTTPP